jgi:hypothetical protein
MGLKKGGGILFNFQYSQRIDPKMILFSFHLYRLKEVPGVQDIQKTEGINVLKGMVEFCQ